MSPAGMTSALALALLSATANDVQFWDWFVKAEAHLPDACARPKQIPDAEREIREKLQAARPGLIGEVSCDPKTKRPMLTITADGAQEHFAAVKDMTSALPKLKRWGVVGFRQRRPPPNPKLASDLVFHVAGKTNGKLDIEVYIAGLTPQIKETINVAMYTTLDCLLGEYDTETKLGSIDLQPLPPPARRPADLKSLTELPKVVDKL